MIKNEKPLSEKRKELILIYMKELSNTEQWELIEELDKLEAQAVERLKARTLTEKTFYDMTLKKTFLCISLEDFDEIFGDLK